MAVSTVLVIGGSLLVACASAPDPAGAGGLVGQMTGTSDVEGQPGDPAVGGGGLAAVPMSAMHEEFWRVVGQGPVTDAREWSTLPYDLTQSDVVGLGGVVAEIDEDGEFRLHAPAGEYAVCYWPAGVQGSTATGCDAVDLPGEGVLDAFFGEAGFQIGVVD